MCRHIEHCACAHSSERFTELITAQFHVRTCTTWNTMTKTRWLTLSKAIQKNGKRPKRKQSVRLWKMVMIHS